MNKILRRAVKAVVTLYQENPARGNALIVSAIVTVAGALGVAIAPQGVDHIIEVVVPILVSGELTHRRVKPAR